MQQISLEIKDASFGAFLLSPADAAAAARLHQSVIDAAPAHEKNFLSERSEQDFHTLLQQGHQIVAIVENGRLLAQSILLLPTAQNPDTSIHGLPESFSAETMAPESMAVICGQAVDPAYRHQGFQTLLTGLCLELAAAQGRPHVLSDICTDNIASWKSQIKAGMTICGLSADPAISDSSVYFMYGQSRALKKGELTATFNTVAERTVPMNDMAQQKTLLTSGWRGVGYDKDNNLLFKPA